MNEHFYNVNKHVRYDLTSTLLSKQTYKLKF